MTTTLTLKQCGTVINRISKVTRATPNYRNIHGSEFTKAWNASCVKVAEAYRSAGKTRQADYAVYQQGTI